jgi:ATP-dependent exoDNAse (exonuclease V) beta subunit
MAHAYDRGATLRPADFVARVRTQRMSDPNRNAVRVMTIHQAKGLEFDAVVLPDLDGTMFVTPPAVLVERETPMSAPTRVVRYPNARDRVAFADLETLYDAHAERTVVDALSVLYVAVTRTARALYMVVAPARENEQSLRATHAAVLRGALAAKKPAPPDTVLFEHGDPNWHRSLAAVGSKPEEKVVDLRFHTASSVRQRVLPRVSPSMLEGGETQKLKDRLRLDTGAAARRGTIFHAFFERIEWLEQGVPDDAALAAIASRAGCRPTDASDMIRAFRAMLDHADIARALRKSSFEGDGRRAQVFRELPFAIRDGEGILTGSIDRVVVRRDLTGLAVDAHVFDFKSDGVTDDTLDSKVQLYTPQLRAYQRPVERLFRLKPEHVRSTLLFVRHGRVVDL